MKRLEKRHMVQCCRYLQNGPAHLVKNIAGALRAPGHTLYVGNYFVDLSAALDLDMPPPVFVGFDGQSDREAVSLLNSALGATIDIFKYFFNIVVCGCLWTLWLKTRGLRFRPQSG